MRKWAMFSIFVVLAMVVTPFSAQADMATGAISFGGGYNTNTGNLETATALNFSGIKVSDTGAGTGDFLPLVHDTNLTMPGFWFSPHPSGPAPVPEPSTLLLLAGGLFGLGIWGEKKLFRK